MVITQHLIKFTCHPYFLILFYHVFLQHLALLSISTAITILNQLSIYSIHSTLALKPISDLPISSLFLPNPLHVPLNAPRHIYINSHSKDNQTYINAASLSLPNTFPLCVSSTSSAFYIHFHNQNKSQSTLTTLSRSSSLRALRHIKFSLTA